MFKCMQWVCLKSRTSINKYHFQLVDRLKATGQLRKLSWLEGWFVRLNLDQKFAWVTVLFSCDFKQWYSSSLWRWSRQNNLNIFSAGWIESWALDLVVDHPQLLWALGHEPVDGTFFSVVWNYKQDHVYVRNMASNYCSSYPRSNLHHDTFVFSFFNLLLSSYLCLLLVLSSHCQWCILFPRGLQSVSVYQFI